MREFNKRADELANRGIKEHRKQIKEEPVKTAKSTKEIVEECAAWIKKRVDAAHAKGIILGLSGGIDSAVVAALAKKACGDNVLCVMMPCHSSPSALEDAVLVAEAFDLRTVTVDLTDTYDTMKAAMPELIPYGYANIGPRLRMTTLYAMGSDKGYLVAGTSNRTETMIGYFTKWGDAACDIKPIASFYKYQVYDIARELGVPERLITKPPTADLWEGQTDEGEIGLTYDELDGILEFIDDGEEPAGDPATIEKVKGLIKKSAHKRDAIPVFELK
ncbi:MAG: NAD(+) synthase [Abditibacteriota bacterium]|nr:NAD(+) synthase [Abditibacteriota bacterium]